MALSYKVGNFAQPTTTNASFGVTGVGFKPKALLLYATDQTATGTGSNIARYMGMATSTTNRVGISETQSSGSNTGCRAHDDTKCYLVVNPSATTLASADLVSFDTDGFTLNFGTVDAVARIVGYIALGGADLTNAFIKEFKPAASNTDQSFTGVGFKPDAMILISSQNGTAPPNSETASCDWNTGFGDTALTQEATMFNSLTATESSQRAKIIDKSSSSGSFTCTATLKSFDADGFTLNFTVTSSVKYQYALCLKGGQYKVGTFNQPGSTGNQAITGVGFQPVGLILTSFNAVTNASLVTNQSRNSWGAASGSTSRISVWDGGGNNGTMDNNTDTGKIINMITEGVSPTTNASADFVSFDSGGFTINWTTADATAREVAYMTFGSNASTAQWYSNLPTLGVT